MRTSARGLSCGLLLLAGCAGREAGPPLNILVGVDDGRCTAEIDGEPVAFDPDTADFRPYRDREVHIRGGIDTPYRCIGGVIYALQRARVHRIGFISEPAPAGNESETAGER